MSAEKIAENTNGAGRLNPNGAAPLNDARPFPWALPLEENSASDSIHYSLLNARALADILNTASQADQFESMRDDRVFNISSLLMGYIEDALAKFESVASASRRKKAAITRTPPRSASIQRPPSGGLSYGRGKRPVFLMTLRTILIARFQSCPPTWRAVCLHFPQKAP
jgi:hypothetical protein